MRGSIDMHHVAAVSLLQRAQDLLHKRIAYLACTMFVDTVPDFRIMVVNALRNVHPSEYTGFDVSGFTIGFRGRG